MSDERLSLPVPHPTVVSQPFWQAAACEELVAQCCRDCGRYVFIPQEFCRFCHGDGLEWVRTTGRGTVYSYSIVWRPQTPAFETPYIVAIIEMEEGYKMLSNVVGCERTEVRVGLPVEVTFDHVTEGIALPKFRPQGSVGEARG